MTNRQNKRQTNRLAIITCDTQTEQKTDPTDLAMITSNKQNKRQTQQISNDHGGQTEQKTDPTDQQ